MEKVSIPATSSLSWRTLDKCILDHLQSNHFPIPTLAADYQFHQSLWTLLKLGRVNSSDGLQKFVKDSTTVSNFTGHYLSRSTDVSPRECDDKTRIIFVGMYTSDDAAVYLIYVIYV